MERTFYRDYGSMGFNAVAPDNEVTIRPHRQVYQATHRGDDKRLPFMNRSFISFTFGGKPIEDFDLIATITNNRIERDAYANFEDLVTSYNVLDGQYYWGTHYKTNTLQFVLSTDGIDQATLDEFLYWFQAGVTKELILSEHPNRAILARVSSPPQISLLPFEYDTVIFIKGKEFPSKTTLYKGDINLELTMDQPHWYAKDNILGTIEEVEVDGQLKRRYIEFWEDNSQQPSDDPSSVVDITESPDALKILTEDNIPTSGMIQNNMLLGNGAYASVEDRVEVKTWSLLEDQIRWIDGEPTGYGARICGTVEELPYSLYSMGGVGIDPNGGWLKTESGQGLLYSMPADFIGDAREALPGFYKGYIAGPVVDADGEGISYLASGEFGHLYYAGTAPAPTIISFGLMPQFSSAGYISVPSNKYEKNGMTNQPYDTFTIESKNKAELRFTTPNLYSSYNEVIYLFKQYIRDDTILASWEDLRQKIRENVRHPHVRQWAIKLIESVSEQEDGYKSNQIRHELCSNMRTFFEDDLQNIVEALFVFNSETGEATGTFAYRVIDEDNNESFTVQTEDVGDMLRSNYIIIRDRNHPTKDGFVVSWEDTNEVTKEYSHRIYHDVATPLMHVQILYKNMYL